MKPITESHIHQSATVNMQAQGWAYRNSKDTGHGGQGNFTIFAIEPTKVTEHR